MIKFSYHLVGGVIFVFHLLCQQCAWAQSPAQQLDGLVDNFTGDLRYSVPLLTIPGPNGEAFPLTATYRAGIGMEQQASWIGLGWNLSVGEVGRSVLGAPDDWNGGEIEEVEAHANGATPHVVRTKKSFYGPIHFKNIYDHNGPEEQRMDLYVSRKGVTAGTTDEFAFEFPDYDRYHVSGPGIGGLMKPYLFQYANLFKPEPGHGDPNDPDNYVRFTERPRFRFMHEPAATVNAPYFNDHQEALGALFAPYSDLLEGFTDNSPNAENEPDPLWASNYIEYWTNEDLVNAPPSDFMEHAHNVQRGLNGYADFEKDGIGAFRITTPTGMVYHYSLPVYAANEVVREFVLDPDNSTESYELVTDDPENPVKLFKKNGRYASSWKLTAVTGSNFKDNGDGVVGPGDRGYWVAVHYGKWTDAFNWRHPFFGYAFDQRVKRWPDWRDPVLDDGQYQPTGTVTSGTREVYYPHSVRTSSHAAYFIYDARADGHSVPNHNGHTVPSLALKRIVLLNADNTDPLTTNVEAMTSSEYPGLSAVANVHVLLSEDHYAANAGAIEAISLRTVEFEQDNSLCQGGYNNVYSTVSANDATPIAAQPGDLMAEENNLFRAVGQLQTSTLPGSGKLTLKGIRVFGDRHQTHAPGHRFEYGTGNPFFDHHRKDHFGSFKKNHDAFAMGGYITEKNDEHLEVDAWSLNRIITPLGAEITVDYESDVYDRVAYDAHNDTRPVHPFHTFLIKGFSLGSVNTMTTFDPDAYHYFDDPEQRLLASGIGARLHCSAVSPPCSFQASLSDMQVTHPIGSELFDIGNLPLCEYDNYYHPCDPGDYYGFTEDMYGVAFAGFRLKWAYGGGLRVREVSITEPDLSETYGLRYSYSDGVLTTEPDRFSKTGFGGGVDLQKNHHGADRHARSPMVGYSRVEHEIVGNDDRSMGKEVREFHNHLNGRQPHHRTRLFIDENPPFGTTHVSGMARVDDHDLAGKLKAHHVFDKKGVAIAKNNYTYEKLGRVDEAFYQQEIDNGIVYRLIYLKRDEQYVLKGTESLLDDRVHRMEILQRDGLTGIPLKTRTVNEADGVEVSVTELAHANVAGMGSKFIDPQNKNMLTVSSASYIRKGSDTGPIRDASISVWSETVDRWEWDPTDNAYARNAGNTGRFVSKEHRIHDGTSDPQNWKTLSETTLLDADGRVLERSDAGGRYNSVRYGYNDRYVVAQASNSPFQAFTHSGFETVYEPEAGHRFFEGQIHQREATVAFSSNDLCSHSGERHVRLDGNVEGPLFVIQEEGADQGLERGRTYHASVWIHMSSYFESGMTIELNGTWDGMERSMSETATRYEHSGLILNDWKRLDVELTVPDDYSPVGSGTNDLRVYLFNPGGPHGNAPAYFDDMRVHPMDAPMEGMVYDQHTGRMTYALDRDNLATKFEYDAAGNVTRVWEESEEGFVKQLETVQHFGRND